MQKNRKYKTYITYATMGIGGIFTGILLIPAGMIHIMWIIIDRIVRWCDKGVYRSEYETERQQNDGVAYATPPLHNLLLYDYSI